MCGHLLGGYPGRCKSPVTKHVNSADCQTQCTSFAPCIGYSHSNKTYPQACVIITSTAWSCPYNPGAPYDYVDGAIASTASELIATTMMTVRETLYVAETTALMMVTYGTQRMTAVKKVNCFNF